ncbi:MAG: hypothetical protein J2P53_04750, partial [Bradyrhizobiaceae bacterium]|nr:hypothetical protein [Bradyrhizobiaceae bacterium]
MAARPKRTAKTTAAKSASGKGQLREYARKRDFARTPEPQAAPKRARKAAPAPRSGAYAIQRHD